MTPEAESKPQSPRILSVPELMQAAHQSPHRAQIRASVEAMRSEGTSGLLDRIKTLRDPLILWATHLALDQRHGVPPCLRGTPVGVGDQFDFITWLADVFWLAQRHRDHQTAHQRWQGLFRYPPASPEWHRSARWVYGQGGRRGGHFSASALGLSQAQRLSLMSMPTQRMVGNRQQLAAMGRHEQRLMEHAIDHPDKAGLVTPTAVTTHRMTVVRVYLLANRNKSMAARFFELLTQRRMSRQVLCHHLRQVEIATGQTLL